MIFSWICDDCGYKIDFDKGEDDQINCPKCGGSVSASPELEVD